MTLLSLISGKLAAAGVTTKVALAGTAAVATFGAAGVAGATLLPTQAGSTGSLDAVSANPSASDRDERGIAAALAAGAAHRSDTATAVLGGKDDDTDGDTDGDVKTCPSHAPETTDDSTDGPDDSDGRDRVARGDHNDDGHGDCGRGDDEDRALTAQERAARDAAEAREHAEDKSDDTDADDDQRGSSSSNNDAAEDDDRRATPQPRATAADDRDNSEDRADDNRGRGSDDD